MVWVLAIEFDTELGGDIAIGVDRLVLTSTLERDRRVNNNSLEWATTLEPGLCWTSVLEIWIFAVHTAEFKSEEWFESPDTDDTISVVVVFNTKLSFVEVAISREEPDSWDEVWFEPVLNVV